MSEASPKSVMDAKTNEERVHRSAGVQRQLFASVKQRKLKCYGHIPRKEGDCLKKEIMQVITLSSRDQGRPTMIQFDNIAAWTGLLIAQQYNKP